MEKARRLAFDECFYAGISPEITQRSEPETITTASPPGGLLAGCGAENSAPGSNISVTPQYGRDPKSIPSTSQACNRQSASSTTDGEGGPTSSRTCTGMFPASHLLRIFRDVTSDEVMVFLLLKDGEVGVVESSQKVGLLTNCRPTWAEIVRPFCHQGGGFLNFQKPIGDTFQQVCHEPKSEDQNETDTSNS